MNDWYPNQDPKRVAFLQNLAASSDRACGLLRVPARTYAEAAAAAQAWLVACAQRQDTQRSLDRALLAR